MIVRAMGLGFVLWLIATAIFRFAGQYFFLPDETPRMILFVATPFIVGFVTFASLKLLKEARGDEAEAALGLAIPGMVLDAFVVHEFQQIFPNLDPALDSAFGALMLLAYGTVLFVGLSMTKLAPQDERV
jgi:hypothetical protein